MYVYKSETNDDGDKVYAVGYWRPAGANGSAEPVFAVASRHNSPEQARRRVSYLNGGAVPASSFGA